MVDRARANEKIEFLTPSVVEEVLGEERRDDAGCCIRDLETGETREVPRRGVFVAIGHDPNTTLFLDQLDHDEAGYLVTKPGSTETNIAGVFAAGDVQDHIYRQAVTAAGQRLHGRARRRALPRGPRRRTRRRRRQRRAARKSSRAPV